MLSHRAAGWWLGAFVLVLAACSDDSSESAASTTSSTSTSTSTSTTTATSTTTTTTVPVEPGPYVGTFYTVDLRDGRQISITIDALEPQGDDGYTYSYLHVDEYEEGCIGEVGSATPASATGTITTRTGDDVLVLQDFQNYCRLNGPDDEDWPFPLFTWQIRYDAASDRLVSGYGPDSGLPDACWTREPPGPAGC